MSFIAQSRRGFRAFSSVSFGHFGKPSEVLRIDPSSVVSAQPRAGEVKVSVKASQVLWEDIRWINGISLANTSRGVAGTTAVGFVSEVAPGESTFKVNDFVLVIGPGLWADQVTVPSKTVAKIHKFNDEDAATLPSFVSAWIVLNNFTKLAPGNAVIQSHGDSSFGQAVSQVAKAMGLQVINPTTAELEDSKNAAKINAEGKVKLAIISCTGKPAINLIRSISGSGAAVAYNGQVEPLSKDAGIEIPAASTIYNQVSMNGFDLQGYAATNHAAFQDAVANVMKLGEEKKIHLKPKVFSQSDVKTAISEVVSTNGTVVLKL